MNSFFYAQVREFSRANNLPPKAILLLDNCSAHKPIEALRSKDGNIIAMFLPPNVTAVIQPMDQNSIKITKLKYRNMLLAGIVAQEDVPVHDLLNALNVRDAILLLKSAWEDLPQSVLQKSWSKIFEWDDNESDAEDNVPLSELMQDNDVYNEVLQETTQLLSKIAVDVSLSTKEIEEWNDDELDEDDTEDISDDEDENERGACSEPPVSYTDAINSVNALIKWSEYNREYSNAHIANLIQLRTDIVKKEFAKPKTQTKLTSFFSRNE